MAARRLLIVMLILLGLSTLAAALVPQGALRNGTTTGTTTTQSIPTTPSVPITDVLPPVAEITVGGGNSPWSPRSTSVISSRCWFAPGVRRRSRFPSSA